MVITLNVLLMILAFVCLLLAALGLVTPKVNLGWLGLAFWALSQILR
jgi:hypothetical protein